ncbi:MAG: transglutaminase family protein, partial [Gallionella sp.]
MTIRVALSHKTRYQFDRPVGISPHEVRLRPAAHCRTPILSYSLKVLPAEHFINWQQDPYGNHIARLVFPKPSTEMEVTVDLVADMTVINPFDFFVEKYAEYFPFAYPDQLRKELVPFLETEEAAPRFIALFDEIKNSLPKKLTTTDFLVEVNRRLHEKVAYTVRLDPGVQSCEETLSLKSGSCRDTGWLLVHLLRHFSIAARFVSGYLIQLAADVKSLDGPSGTDHDFTDLHAWAEAFIPGAGWVGLDPTSGLLAGEGHIPLACTAAPISAAPITGLVDVCEATLDFAMNVTRIHEDPRVTKPYTEHEWQAIDALGGKVDKELAAADVRLTTGGEPTFVSIDDMEGAEWNLTALGKDKRKLAGSLLQRLKLRFAPNGLLHFGQGKWYPGEPLPRWALGCYWRIDGKPMWNDIALIADEDKDYGYSEADAKRFIDDLAGRLGLDVAFVLPAYEDVWHHLMEEQRLPLNIQPLHHDLATPEARMRLAALLMQGLGKQVGFVLPLKAAEKSGGRWFSSSWPLKREQIFLLPGDSPLGYRLPLGELPWVAPDEREVEHPRDPFDARPLLDGNAKPRAKNVKYDTKKKNPKSESPREIIHTALCVEVRGGRLHVFMPPLPYIEDYLALVSAVEQTARSLAMPLWLEGYPPPRDPRVQSFQVTPDPGVIEVNIHPAKTWEELVANTTLLYEEARLTRLGTEKFMIDGRHTGTGGGNHITLGGPTPADSPMLRRPDLLKSLIAYWQNHPALSYL